ncbi:MAG: DUF2974 domain-containing protein, partial [Lachnospiraceae bacterium]|nr:DUF2974 domain-containing protein [Lachnospiraceae bacterium]
VLVYIKMERLVAGLAGTIIEYIKKYGDYTFSEKPMNDVDSLALCQFCYLKFDGMVPLVTENRKSVTMQDLMAHEDYEKLYADERFEKNNRALFEAMIRSRRFKTLKMNCYVNIVETEWETQFSAITFFLEDGTMYIAYRGTDETIVGWKEDFNMAFQSPVPGQAYAVKYLNMVTGKLHNRFYLGGHSKGGNLAVYAAMNCSKQVRERIIKIYSMDGPGFRREVLDGCQYEQIADKIVKILPHSSLIGMLFETFPRIKVVESKTFGLLQHDPYTWLIAEDDFVCVKGLYKSRKHADETLNKWLEALDENQRRIFVDTLYQVVSASKAENLIELSADWKKSMNGMVSALKEVDDETRQALRAIIKALFDIALERMKPQKSKQKRVKET